MSFLAGLVKTLIPAMLPTLLTWLKNNSASIIRDATSFMSKKKALRVLKERAAIRDALTKQIEIAAEKGDVDELEKLHVALHVINTLH